MFRLNLRRHWRGANLFHGIVMSGRLLSMNGEKCIACGNPAGELTETYKVCTSSLIRFWKSCFLRLASIALTLLHRVMGFSWLWW